MSKNFIISTKMEAVNIIQFHQELQEKTNAQLLWWPSTKDKAYRFNVMFMGNTSEMVNHITKYFVETPDLIQLTLRGNYVYYDY